MLVGDVGGERAVVMSQREDPGGDSTFHIEHGPIVFPLAFVKFN